MDRPHRLSRAIQVIAVLLILVVASCASGESTNDELGQSGAAADALSATCRHEFDHDNPEQLVPKIESVLWHSEFAYTQGLTVHDGEILETTGRVGESELRRLDRATGDLISATALPASVFGEGVTVVGDALWQVTWQDERAFKWQRGATGEFEVTNEAHFEGEGWGLVTIEAPRDTDAASSADGYQLWMSNGTDKLSQRDLDTFAEINRATVTRRDGDANQLNELEWDGDWIWANRFLTNEIVRIDPDCLVVSAVVDANNLAAHAQEVARSQDIEPEVMNGIAYDPDTETYLLTGKWWPTMYEVTFVPE